MKFLIPFLIPILLSCSKTPLEPPYILGEVYGKESLFRATHLEILNNTSYFKRGEVVYTFDISCFFLTEIGDTISGMKKEESGFIYPISWDCKGEF